NNDVYLSDVIFDNNQAYTSTSYSDGDGGAIDVTDNNSDSKHPSGYTIVNNTAFTNNTAEGYGGAIYTNSVTAPYLIDISVDDIVRIISEITRTISITSLPPKSMPGPSTINPS
ncbi:hypothetical protein, partial [Escherichia coli]|uniref:hypothetical protein n=1 Tax=Escherichia coli TaxID=562 RepID=UPI00257376AC